jgi:hypothetical protein
LAKTYKYLQGKVSWVKHLKPDEKFGKWSVKFYPDPKSLEVIREMMTTSNGVTGIKNVLGKDDDGYHMSFSRAIRKEYKDKQGGVRVHNFEPPRVMKADGSPWPSSEAIGNGSDATIKLEYYTYPQPTGGKGSAVRWEALRIDNAIPYDVRKDLTEEEFEKYGELAEQPKQELWP